MTKKQMALSGLACAGCAAKIETEISSLPGVRSASVDFVSQKLWLEFTDDTDLSQLYPEIAGIITRIEPGVRVDVKDISKAHETNQKEAKGSGEYAPKAPKELIHEYGEDIYSMKGELARLAVGGGIFALGLLLPLAEPLDLMMFLVSYVIVGGRVVLRAARNILRGQVFDEHFLMTVATLGAFLIGEYPEGVAVMLFYLVGELFQDRAVSHSRKSIRSLMDIRPDYANLLPGGCEEGNGIPGCESRRVSPEEVGIGDRILVKPGEKIPLDGRVLQGTSLVDTSALTGESMPRELSPGSEALSGFINQNGLLTIEVARDFSHSTMARILELVQHAASRKSPTEKFITKFARYYTPVVVFLALAIAFFPPLVVPGATFQDWIYRALVFLVISCPCALVISIPLGFFGGIGGASKRGILVKGSNYLEALNSVETVVFDKTGTLTKGIFEVTDANPQPGFKKDELVEAAAYAESHSNHPIAQSIRSYYGKEIDFSLIDQYEETAGHGIRARISGKNLLVGNERFLRSEGIACEAPETLGTTVHVAINDIYAGFLLIADQVKADAADAIRELKALGVRKTIMLTGDTRAVGESIGRKLGLDEVQAGLLPEDKVAAFERIGAQKTRHQKVVFVGDGINDAPVLARADIGMAMGALGSDAAIEAADIVIMTDEPTKVATAIKVARRTRRIVYQNIVFALGVKAIFLALGALGVASMWEAVFADVGVALIAIFNAMRVLNTSNLG